MGCNAVVSGTVYNGYRYDRFCLSVRSRKALSICLSYVNQLQGVCSQKDVSAYLVHDLGAVIEDFVDITVLIVFNLFNDGITTSAPIQCLQTK